MEDRVKKYRRQKGILGFIVMFIGLMTYDLLGFSGDRIFRYLFGAFVAIIVYTIHDLYYHFKYPKMKSAEKVLDKDERNIMIRGKSSYVTMMITLFSLIIPMIIGIATENILLTIFSIGLYFFIFVVFTLSKSYWDKRM